MDIQLLKDEIENALYLLTDYLKQTVFAELLIIDR